MPPTGSSQQQQQQQQQQRRQQQRHPGRPPRLTTRRPAVRSTVLQRQQAAQQAAVDACIARMQALHGDWEQELAVIQGDLEQQAGAARQQREVAMQQVAALDSTISELDQQLCQLQEAASIAAPTQDTRAEHSSEDVELLPVLSRSQRRRRHQQLARRRAAATAAQQLHPLEQQLPQVQHDNQPPQPQQVTRHESAPQLPQQQHQRQQQQQQQQHTPQQPRGTERAGLKVLQLPVLDQPFSVTCESEAEAVMRVVRQAQLAAQLDSMELDSESPATPPGDVGEVAYEEDRHCPGRKLG